VLALRTTLLVAVLSSTVLSTSATAQIFGSRPNKGTDQWIFNLAGLLAVPVGDFRKDEKIGGGLEVAVGFQPFRRQPLVLRGSMGGLMYERYNNNDDDEICDFFGNNCEQVTLFYDSQHHFLSFIQAGPEFMATDGRWRPYAYALAGVSFFNSTASYGDADDSGSGTRNLFSSHNFSTSYAVGVRRVTQTFGREGGLDLSARFVRNAKARYLTENGVYRDASGNFAISPRSGAASLLIIQVGITGGPFVNWSER
jgi:hypothetical protein